MRKRTSRILSLVVVMSLIALGGADIVSANGVEISNPSWVLKVIVDQGDILPRAHLYNSNSGGDRGDDMSRTSLTLSFLWLSHLFSILSG